jgi:formate C-acetyltransferase
MSITQCGISEIHDNNLSGGRVAEAINILREKDIHSATIERLKLSWEAHALVQELPQPLQLGEGLYYLLDRISLPIHPHDLILGRITEEIPDEEGETLLQKSAQEWRGGIPQWMQDGGHECLDWERLLRLGLSGLEEFTCGEIARRVNSGEKGAHIDFLRGAVRIYQAFRNYARRYALAAQKAGLYESSKNCSAIADAPPKTLAEALQLMWIVGIVYCSMASKNPTLTFGRMDDLLIDFYRKDVAAGILTREKAGDLIEDFYCKNNLILGRGEHQMSGGSERDTGWLRNLAYDAPQYVVIGGTRQNCSPPADELTEIFLERVVPRFENPVMVLRYTSDLPEHVWRLACEKMRSNASFMVYNDNNVIPAMIHSGVDKRDAVTYTMHGCNWPDIPAKQRQVFTYMPVIPRHFLNAFMDHEELTSIDELYQRFRGSFRAELEEQCQRFRKARSDWHKRAPGVLRIDDCFLDGTIENARDWSVGGTRYATMTCAICSIASAADCFAAVDELVFSSKKISAEELRDALSRNFQDRESLRQRCLNAPKFGQDNTQADSHAARVLNTVLEEIDRASRLGTQDEIIIFRCLETDMRHIRFGADLGATPDGRLAGKPLSENTSPYPGSCTEGITAMFRSIAKLPLDKINSGALNVRIQPKMVAREEGLYRLAALLRTYFNMGGLQIQTSLADTEELRDAQIHPESHKDLMVRITGYSAVFVDMCKRAQDEIIRRQEMED